MNTRLRNIIESEPNTIRSAVAESALDYHNAADFFRNVMQSGCISGMVPGLIYYVDTAAFFEAHYAQIEELREEYEDSRGEPLRIRGDLKNWLAWFSFEETAYRMAAELGMEI